MAVADRQAHDSSEDTRLLTLVAEGDHAALVALYRRLSPLVHGLARRSLGDAGLAEEAVQEAFVRLWRAAPRFDPTRGGARTFAFTIARSACIDVWRRPSSRPLPLTAEPDVLADDGAERVVAGMVVRAALAELSPAHREVLELGFDEGLTQAEISTKLGIPLGTVKTRTFHALRALRSALDNGNSHG
jgi:RNA polymerase sigma-70 factor (ECF subfamily)